MRALSLLLESVVAVEISDMWMSNLSLNLLQLLQLNFHILPDCPFLLNLFYEQARLVQTVELTIGHAMKC